MVNSGWFWGCFGTRVSNKDAQSSPKTLPNKSRNPLPETTFFFLGETSGMTVVFSPASLLIAFLRARACHLSKRICQPYG